MNPFLVPYSCFTTLSKIWGSVQYPDPASEYSSSWTLDYSRQKLDTLNEARLNELAGIGGDPAKLVPIGPVFDEVYGEQPLEIVPEGGLVDFNHNTVLDTPPQGLEFSSGQ